MGQQQRRLRQLCVLLTYNRFSDRYEPRRHESTALVTQSQIMSVQFKEENTNLHDRISLQLRPVQDVAIFLTVHHAPSSQGLAISRRSKSSKTAKMPEKPRPKNRFTTKTMLVFVCGASISAYACFGLECRRKSRAVVFGSHESLTASFIQLSACFIKSPREGRSKD